jgi:hypothetical protein
VIPEGYAAAVHAWAVSPEISPALRTERGLALLAERDTLVSGGKTGVMTGGMGVREIASGSLNGKTFTFAPGITPAEKLTVLSDVLERLGLISHHARLVTTTHGNFCNLQR